MSVHIFCMHTLSKVSTQSEKLMTVKDLLFGYGILALSAAIKFGLFKPIGKSQNE